MNEWKSLGRDRGAMGPIDEWWEEEQRQGMSTEASGAGKKERDELDEGKVVEQRSTLVPVRGTRKRTSSWYIIDQRLICQGLENLLRSDYGTTSVNLGGWARQREQKRPG